MTKDQRDSWQKRQDTSYEPMPWQGLQIHSQNTAKHEFVKFVICWVLDEMDREWDTEVQAPNGRVDIYDLGPVDEKPVVYEVETNVTTKRKREKHEQYYEDFLRDVLVIDPEDVPTELNAAIDYVRENVIIGA